MRELAPGTVLAGYRIESLVGRGGMGVVYRAVQIGLDRIVALKVIAPELLDDDDVRARFLSEARAAASVDHPNVIPVHGAGEDDGIAYIAMRFVAGHDLRSLVRRGGALDPAEATDFVAQAAAALDAIHRAGFVHRDVKPANLLVDRDGHVYLTDFGLAKAVLTRSGGTRTGHWVGTLDYVAPEQIRGGRIDARADVYALGGVLHHALTGRVPFEREGDEAKLWAQLSAPPPVPSALRRGLPAEFDVAVARAMAKDPDERYPSAGDLGRAARAAATGATPTQPERIVARGAARPGGAPSEPGIAGEVSTRTAQTALAPSRRRRAPLAAAGAALAAAAVAAVLLTRDGDGDAARDSAGTPAPTRTASATPTPDRLPRVVRTIEGISDRPSGIALAGGDLWVTSARQPFLTRVDAATGRERRDHPRVGNDISAIVAYRDSVWVGLGTARQVVRLDGRTGAERARFDVGVTPRRLAVNRRGVWIANGTREGEPGAVMRYDPDSGALLQSITVQEGVGGMIAAGEVLWVVKRASSKLARLQPGGAALVDWTGLPGQVRTMRYAGGKLWVVINGEDTIVRVDAARGRDLTGSAGRSPTQVLLAGGKLFVASRNDHTVVVLDPDTLKQAEEPLEVGLNPTAMVADKRFVWVTGASDNTLTQIAYR